MQGRKFRNGDKFNIGLSVNNREGISLIIALVISLIMYSLTQYSLSLSLSPLNRSGLLNDLASITS